MPCCVLRRSFFVASPPTARTRTTSHQNTPSTSLLPIPHSPFRIRPLSAQNKRDPPAHGGIPPCSAPNAFHRSLYPESGRFERGWSQITAGAKNPQAAVPRQAKPPEPRQRRHRVPLLTLRAYDGRPAAVGNARRAHGVGWHGRIGPFSAAGGIRPGIYAGLAGCVQSHRSSPVYGASRWRGLSHRETGNGHARGSPVGFRLLQERRDFSDTFTRHTFFGLGATLFVSHEGKRFRAKCPVRIGVWGQGGSRAGRGTSGCAGRNTSRSMGRRSRSRLPA